MEDTLQNIYELISIWGIKVLAAFAIFIIGRWVSKGFRNVVKRLMSKRKVDATIVGFIGNLTYVALLAFFIIAALGQLGIQTTSFIAILGAAGLAVGLALQGSLSNFASGFLMIIFKPIRVNDYVEIAGTAGTVEELSIFTTTLKTPDNKTVIIPMQASPAETLSTGPSKGHGVSTWYLVLDTTTTSTRPEKSWKMYWPKMIES